ncbi:exodeoxyribonuclease V subunit beta [Francisella frigiditurris]|uniref:RecBCD enzyme subunit RecB n=1 Tax=Francisella frigiditurris TaxID=1542390 RepID=A0A1J0KT96_9GAMM|nr:exodeoxyribonuclease V subunit beta [Francisella frigiditurris]APC96870.1 exodeoxyribonuclease V, beta subunit [Francisella frigiditurris]
MKNLDTKTIPLNGRHIIEASAGTGKTYNITELYVRLLLEKKLLPSQILVMTFTKDATQEIIGRVESKLRDVIRNHKSGKEVLSEENYKYLKRALLEIDEAAIFTIHGFCKKVLSEQAFTSGIEMDVSMEVDTSDILQKVVEDFFRNNINNNQENYEYLKAFKLHTPEKFLGRNGLWNVVKSNYEILTSKEVFKNDIEHYKREIKVNITNGLNTEIDEYIDQKGFRQSFERVLMWLDSNDIAIPKDAYLITKGNLKAIYKDLISISLKKMISLAEDYTEFKQTQFIQQSCSQIRKNFIKAKEQKGVLDFNDLITKLCQSVQTSTDIVKTLQTQYPVALIDEFQDTDAEQYQILDTIYPTSKEELMLLMIGDPKQAIYGFRGGDIFTYLKAKASCPAENHWSMDTNWRSTSQMIKAYNRLFYKDDYEIDGAVGKDIFSEGIDYQTVKASPNADSKNKVFDDNFQPINYFYYDVAEDDNKNDIDTKLSAWTANEIVRLLSSKKVTESDIAILVENGKQAKVIQQALQQKNLSSVYLSQRDNVYKSQEAQEILFLMEGINELENKYLLKKALSTSLLGGSAEKFLAYFDEEKIEEWGRQIDYAKGLRDKWHKYGFMSFIMQILHESFIQRTENKQRVITNVLHLAELIKVAENKYKHPNQLIKWYRQQIKSDTDLEGELRLESNDNLIKIITIHGSKGLEYPIVFIPFASYVSSKKFLLDKVNKYYDKELAQTVYKIGKDDSIKDIVDNEAVEELMRLFYVAVTRAEHRCYIGVAKYQSKKGAAKIPSDDSYNSPLAQFVNYKKDEDWLEKVQKITNNPANQSLLLEINNFQSIEIQHTSYNVANQELKASQIHKLENDNWEMLSFSKISKSKPQNIILEKENDESEDDKAQEIQQKLEFRFTATKGADIGNILHNVLEHTDFSTGEIDDTLLQEQMNRYKVVAAEDFNNLKSWLEECLTAPISEIEQQSSLVQKESNFQGELFDDNKSVLHTSSFCLKDILNSKTLKEAEFYFPVTNKKLYKTNIIKALGEYRGREIDYDKLSNQKVFGMLHGFIDLIFEYNGKYYVADYKSNYLGDSLEDYSQEKMRQKNQDSFYDLQYLIYSVALHRYLSSNLPSYSFDKHFGGVYYFYLRGFKDGFGVYKTKIERSTLEKMDSIFTGANDV